MSTFTRTTLASLVFAPAIMITVFQAAPLPAIAGAIGASALLVVMNHFDRLRERATRAAPSGVVPRASGNQGITRSG
jgi:hypothetical protein